MFRTFIGKSTLLALVLVSTAFALLMGELVLRFVFNPGDFLYAEVVDHPFVGARIKPGTTGHDMLGYRNREVPDRADVVVLGDSMTYGVGAPRDSTWPDQFAALLRKTVYNMGLGGYGPLEYLYLAEHDAARMQPRLLLVGFYIGNDLIDAYNAVRHYPYLRSWREPGSADADGTEYQRISQTEPKKHFAALRDWLSKNSVLYSVAREVLLQPLSSWEQDRLALQAGPDRQLIWRDPSRPSVRTIFNPQLKLSAMDPKLPSVQEGIRITKRTFEALQNAADTQGRRLLMILIPTKERIYCRYLKDTGTRMPRTLASLCEAEAQVKEDLERFLVARKIAYVDVSGAMEEQVQNHVQLYPPGTGSHPLAAGYGVIAHAVYDAIRRNHFDQ